jgi:hypothetical protein
VPVVKVKVLTYQLRELDVDADVECFIHAVAPFKVQRGLIR